MRTVTTRWKVYFMCGLGLMSAVLAVVGFLQSGLATGMTSDKEDPIVMMVVGLVGFAFFFPLFMVLYFARHLMLAVERLEQQNTEIRARLEALSKSNSTDGGRPNQENS